MSKLQCLCCLERQVPQTIAEVVAVLKTNTLLLLLHVLSAHLQYTDQTGILFALSLNDNDITSLQLFSSIAIVSLLIVLLD